MNLRRLAMTLCALFLSMPVMTQAESVETIAHMKVQADIHANGTVTFQENILYDFGINSRHGIYRYIPVDYRRYGARYNLDLHIQEVMRDQKNEQYTTEITPWKGEGDSVRINIGDPNQTIVGEHAYALKYSSNKAINFFDDHDELYWNVTGNGWDIPIEQSVLSIVLPSTVSVQSINTICYTGVIGSTEQACTATITNGEVQFYATRVLGPSESLTIALAFPKGVVHEPTWFERIKMLVTDNVSVAFPIAALCIMMGLWWTRGKDPELKTIIPQYESPDALSPALIQAISAYGHCGDRGITATIIDLACRGYLHIVFSDDDKSFSVKRIKESDEQLSDAEKLLYKGLFEKGDVTTVEALQIPTFHVQVSLFKHKIHTLIEEMNIFEMLPEKVRGWYIMAGFGISFLLYFLIAQHGALIDIVSAIATGCIVAIIGWIMPRRTQRGTRIEERIEGFKLFLSVTETDRIAFHDAPEKKPEQFSQFLAYAIAFGIEEKWAAQFKDHDFPPPEWAEGYSGSANSVFFASRVSHFHSTASNSAYAMLQSHGGGGGSSGFSGGSSGGGGGGGGGGSW